MRTLLTCTLLPIVAAAGVVCAAPAPAAAPATPALHCQVPCGIYGDRTRVDMLMEDADTIAKAMGKIAAGESEDTPMNQLVRWVVTKEEHAQSIQDTVASYWLAQRVKNPGAGDDAARAKYLRQLELLHGITVAAMKCKQTTDPAHVAKLRELALEFSGTYFSGADLEHIQTHHGGDHK